MNKRYILKNDQKEGILKVEPNQLIELEDNHKSGMLQIPSRFSIYYKKKEDFFNYNNILTILFLLCLAILILLKFILYNYFSTRLERNFEILLSNICFAFIASYIFYNVVTKGVEKHKKTKAYAIICGILDSIVNSGNQIEKNIWIGNYRSDKNGFKNACDSINLSEIKENSTNSKADHLIYYASTKIKSDIKTLYNYMPFLESEILHKVNNIQNSTFTTYINILPVLKEKNLTKFSEDIIIFLDMTYELDKMNIKLKAKYLKGYEKKN